MQNSYRKNILRDFKGNLSRFLSLFGIVALGVMILTGLVSFAPSMRIAGQKYYVEQNVFDLRVLSTLGLSEDDIDAIASTEGVTAVEAVKYLDVEGHWSSTDEPAVLRVQQLPADPDADTGENMNRLVLLDGRMPEAADECVVHVMGHGEEIPLGTTLTLPDDTDSLSRTEYTVVGLVQDPLHFSSDQETSTAGDGVLDDIVFVPDGSLTADYYTVCYIKAENADLYDNYSDEYQAAVDAVADRLTAISDAQCVTRRESLITDANEKLADAKQTYNEQKAEAERQFAEAEQKLADAEAQLTAAKAQLEQGEADYASGKEQLTQQQAALPDTMQSGADQVLDGQEQILAFEDQLQQIELLVNLKQVADPLLGYAEAALNNAQKALDEAEPDDEDYTELRDLLAQAQASYDNISGQLNGYQQQLDAGKQQMYAQGLISSPTLSNTELVTEAKAALRKMKLQLMQGQLGLSTGTATAYSAFAAAEQQLADARTQLDDGWAEYNSGREQLDASRTEYETQKAEAEQKLADGQQQINDAEEQISDIQNGEWYVLDRGSTMSFVTYEQYADRMDAIARVFPVFFFLVAALVASTTMTRMVDENRLQMGTLKALGYSNTKIAGKYLFYGLAASVLGSIVGMIVGFIVFPTIIWQAYQTMVFSLPTFTLQFYPGMALGSVLLSAAVIGFATWEACRASLKEKTAALRNLGADLSAFYTKLEADAKFGTPYSLPAATADQLGGVKVGEALDIDPDGTVSARTLRGTVATLDEKITAAAAVTSDPRAVWSFVTDGTTSSKKSINTAVPSNVDYVSIRTSGPFQTVTFTYDKLVRGGSLQGHFVYGSNDATATFKAVFSAGGTLTITLNSNPLGYLYFNYTGYHYPTLADVLNQVTAMETSVTDLQVALCELYEGKEEA